MRHAWYLTAWLITLAASLWLLLAVGGAYTALALAPPEPGMLERMRAEGTLDAALERAQALGNYELQRPNRGVQYRDLEPAEFADQIMQHHGWALDRQGKSVSELTAQQLSPTELDLNNDRSVDERDVLGLGYAQPRAVAKLPSQGTRNVLCLFIDFPDYPAWYSQSEIQYRWFEEGDDDAPYRSLRWYYEQSSYGQLTLAGTAFYHTASQNRSYYHPDNSNSYAYEEERRRELLEEAVTALDAQGHDFSQYDNDGDGSVDYYAVLWTGPHGDWISYWWPMCFYTYAIDATLDGVNFNNSTLSWQWEQRYPFGDAPPDLPDYTPTIAIHETGHALGLPDLYDYDVNVGPDGGVGYLDIMDGSRGDHNCFSKYVLGWLAPTIAYTNLDDEALGKSHAVADAVLFMPGFDPVTPWGEYFMAQYRCREGIDFDIPSDGMLLWHVDSSALPNGVSEFNNSYSPHKLLKLMEADGFNEIEGGDGYADAGDYYQAGAELSPTSDPDSDDYDNDSTGITCDDFSTPGAEMTADFTMYTSNPPQVTIDAPGAGSTVSGNAVNITVSGTDDIGIIKMQVLIDGQLVHTWNSWSSPSSYNWNTFVEYNKTLNITARAWDGQGQAGSATISVTVSNSGVTQINDGFDAGLGNWRAVNTPETKLGSFTEWSYRFSPGSPPPLGSGNEAYVAPLSDGEQYVCNEVLRSQRFDATAFTRAVRLKFHYRCWADGQILYTTDNGVSWSLLANVTSSSAWQTYDAYFEALRGHRFYLGFSYVGPVESDYDALVGFNVDNVLVQQLPSNPPTAQITAPQDGGSVAGPTQITVDASDDVAVAQVQFYINNALVHTDATAPWQYFWDNSSSDNHPALPLKVIATDSDGLVSPPHEIHIALRRAGTYPVYEDLENTTNWMVQNAAPTPDWAWVTSKAYSGTHSYGWVLGGGSDGANYESVRYIGHADLSQASVDDPVLRILYQGDLPTGAHVDVYFVNSWLGQNFLFTLNTDRADWFESSYALDSYVGYSGKFYFYVGNSNINGTGVWLDDFRVENDAPYISSIAPDRGVPTTAVTINGMSFGFTRAAGSDVTFGGGVTAAAGDYLSWSNNQIQVRIPSGATSGNTTVTARSKTSNGVRVAVLLAPPDLQDLQPN